MILVHPYDDPRVIAGQGTFSLSRSLITRRGSAGRLCSVVTDAALEHPHRFALEDATGLAAFIARRLDSLREY